jgi:hypothetical protein
MLFQKSIKKNYWQPQYVIAKNVFLNLQKDMMLPKTIITIFSS